jgi:tRNA(Arg) A34 adenosine deaminase TadA
MALVKDHFLEAAIAEARQGLGEGGIPIGSVLVHDGKRSTILHGEMDALENAGRQPASKNLFFLSWADTGVTPLPRMESRPVS